MKNPEFFTITEMGPILIIMGADTAVSYTHLGKTVVVDCMVLLKYLLSGRQIPANFYYYINEALDGSNLSHTLK